MKPLLDSLQHARVFANDSQIRRLEVEMCGIMPGGKALVRIDRYERRET
jgi:Holliday junction resolvase RusA-like endonuclease